MLNDNPKTPDFEALANLFSMLSNPIRLQILDYLLNECCKRQEGSCSVTDIYTELCLPQPLISKHLKILSDAGLLCFTRQGNKILYTFAANDSIRMVEDYILRFTGIGIDCCK